LTTRPDSPPHLKSDKPNGRTTTSDKFHHPPDPVSLAPSSKGESKVLTRRDSPPHLKSGTPDEFHHPPDPVSLASSSKDNSKVLAPDAPFAKQFTSPPLLPGLLKSLKEMVGDDARPTPIQSLSLKWLLKHPYSAATQLPNVDTTPGQWRQFLLASETGSGKSIAYLLPLLQNLKEAEFMSSSRPRSSGRTTRPYNPRGLILAPTHELSRQLSGFAKSLLHEIKLRVLCVSQANQKSTARRDLTAGKMSSTISNISAGPLGEFEVAKSTHPVDILVGTPMKVLEMVHGRGWDRKEPEEEGDKEVKAGVEEEEVAKKPRRGRDKMVGFGKWRSKPEVGLANIEWVVVDEADVLFGGFYPIFYMFLSHTGF
jgi:ATP-dependent RNA helicase MRH4